MEATIVNFYQTILLRSPSQAELDYWSNQAGNSSAAEVEAAIRGSDEGVRVQTIELPVIALYQGLLERAPEPAGLQYWSDSIASGENSFQDLITSFVGSAEFQAKYPDVGTDASAKEIVRLFYLNLLDREPDAAGLAYWTEQFGSGNLTTASFTSTFVNTPEVQGKIGVQIRDYYADVQDGKIDDPKNAGSFYEDHGQNPGEPSEPGNPGEPGEPGNPGQPGNPGEGTDPIDVPTYKHDTVISKQGQFFDVDHYELYAGDGNFVDGFEVAQTSLSKIELGLKGYVGGTGNAPYVDPEAPSNVYSFNSDEQARFVYSVASMGDKTLSELLDQGYDFRLRVDTDRTEKTNFVDFNLVNDLGPAGISGKAQDSGFDWTRGADAKGAIIDDEGDGNQVTQNIQFVGWYGDGITGEKGTLLAGDYTVVLEVSNQNGLVVEQQIILRVNDASVGIPEPEGNISEPGGGVSGSDDTPLVGHIEPGHATIFG